MTYKYGPNDLQPPEPEEEPEFKIKIDAGPIQLEEEFTAKELNDRIEEIENSFSNAEIDHPIYLNDAEWEGGKLDNKDIAEL